MTPTTYSDIFDLAQMNYKSYELDKLYETSPVNYSLFMTGMLIRVIPYFKNCKQDLTQRDDTTQTFTIELTSAEQSILATLISVQILKREVFDIRQIRGMIQQGSEANRYSEANLLDKKTQLQAHLVELVRQEITDYGIDNVDWSTFGLEL